MADSAINLMREAFPGVAIEIKRVKESPDKALGNGSGIVYEFNVVLFGIH
jgi:hypothetical protein